MLLTCVLIRFVDDQKWTADRLRLCASWLFPEEWRQMCSLRSALLGSGSLEAMSVGSAVDGIRGQDVLLINSDRDKS